MTWVVTAPANNDEADHRAHAVGELATRAIDMLADAASILGAAGPDDDDETPDDILVLASDLQLVRTELVQLFGIHKAQLPRDVVQDLREGFRLANLAGPEHETKRKEITERVVGHEVERLAELTPEEAKALRAELTNLEPKF